MPRFNHGLQPSFSEWKTFNERALRSENTDNYPPDFYSQPQEHHNTVVPSLMNSDVARAPHLPRLTSHDFSAAEYPSSDARPITDAEIPEEWIPVPFNSTTNIYRSTFFAAEAVNHDQRRCEIGLDVLRRVTSDAFRQSDSTSPFPSPTCHPETRAETLEILYDWASETSSGTGNILWLQGPMGVGKSTILHTLAQRLHAAGRLGGSFTFRPQRKTCRNTSTLFCTIAYQLAINIPHLRIPISQAVQRNPAIVGERLATQLEKLILAPCRAAVDFNPDPLTLVIDGLDQCQLDDQQEILHLLGKAVKDQSSQLRILVGSRSEICIAEILTEPSFKLCRSFYVQRSLGDVRTYLLAELTLIQQNCFRPTSGVQSPWLSTQDYESLVETSSGCFLYASTLVRFLSDTEFCPLARLTPVIESLPLSHLSSLDNLYSQILATVPTGSRASLLAILHILTTEIFADLPVDVVEQLLHVKPGRLRRILRYLRAVFDVPDSGDGRITAHHRTFLDFLMDPARSGVFCVAGMQRSMYLARCILNSLAYVHDIPRVNRVGHVAWKHLAAMVDYVTSVYPSADLVPLVRRINPDFFFGSLSTFEELGGKMLSWLNKMYPRPAEAISLWEDYDYMFFLHSIVNDFDLDESDIFPSAESKAIQNNVLLHCPALIRLLRVSMVLPALTPLLQFRVLLGASWDDMRTVVWALRPIFGRNDTELAQIWTILQDPGFASELSPWPVIFRDLACQSIRILKSGYTGAVPIEMIGYWLEWGRYVRSSPPCPELLRELRDFVPRDDSRYGVATESEVYDVVKWFECFADAPQEEWVRWVGYLPEGTKFEREFAYEARWKSWQGLGWCGLSN